MCKSSRVSQTGVAARRIVLYARLTAAVCTYLYADRSQRFSVLPRWSPNRGEHAEQFAGFRQNQTVQFLKIIF